MSVVDLLGEDGFLQIIARRPRAVQHIFGIIAKEVLIRQDHRDYRLTVVNVRLKGYVTPIFALFDALVCLIKGRVILVGGLLSHPELFSHCFMSSPTYIPGILNDVCELLVLCWLRDQYPFWVGF